MKKLMLFEKYHLGFSQPPELGSGLTWVLTSQSTCVSRLRVRFGASFVFFVREHQPGAQLDLPLPPGHGLQFQLDFSLYTRQALMTAA